jgi:hypothetical protein
MNITLERTESSKIKYELENAITFNKKLFEDISYPSFLYNMIGSCNAIQLITLDYLITKYEKECNITVLRRGTIEKITNVHLSMIIIKFKGLDYSIIKQWIVEIETDLVELVKEIDNTKEE